MVLHKTRLHIICTGSLYRLMPVALCMVTVFFFIPSTSFSQLNFAFQAGTFMIKGQVQNIQTKEPLGRANIKITNNGRIYTCDDQGNFTLYVSPKDTLRFTMTGYFPKVVHVADFDSTNYYTLEIKLMHDFVKLKDVTIYPYKSIDEFKQAFVDAKDVNKVIVPGIAPPKYSNKIPKAKLTNPVSFIYDKLRRRRAADPDFKP